MSTIMYTEAFEMVVLIRDNCPGDGNFRVALDALDIVVGVKDSDETAEQAWNTLADIWQEFSVSKRDPWGRLIRQAYDGHSAWGCNNHACEEHLANLYGAR